MKREDRLQQLHAAAEDQQEAENQEREHRASSTMDCEQSLFAWMD